MLSPFRFAGIITVIFAVCGPARAQELAPPGSDVSIHKLVIDNDTVGGLAKRWAGHQCSP